MDQAITKSELRERLRKARRAHAQSQPDSIRALLFNHPPRPLVSKIAPDSVIGLYHATPYEAPAAGYARFFKEAGHRIALPFFADKDAPMRFAEHTDPFAETDLEPGPFGQLQPARTADTLVPDILFVPLVGFTASGKRLGQGGGYYDKWLAEHPVGLAIGLAWDVQLIEPDDALPSEPHDIPLDGVVTPTRMYGNL
jgi:5-formyltetrahydrofolate cyclo-ligase